MLSWLLLGSSDILVFPKDVAPGGGIAACLQGLMVLPPGEGHN